jgi:DeoR/GlpR family transcriptional regulator of sugar metabolism
MESSLMSKSLIPAQRRERIQDYLSIHKIARTIDLCDLLETSEATVRRDLEWLEQEGILERTHGGATLSQRLIFEPEYQHRAQLHPEEKRGIAVLAAALIEPGDIVFINSGTTTTQVIHQIPSNSDITVFTNNLNATLEMVAPGYHYYLVGGEYQSRSRSLSGRFAMENLKQIYANKAILGVDGFSLKHGCTVPTLAEAEIVRQMIERTMGQIILVADRSKWGVVSNFPVAAINEIDILVTDEQFDKAAMESLAAQSVKSMIAPLNISSS